MEKWEKILRRSDAKVRDLPAKPENWERLAADLAKASLSLPPGPVPLWRWWTGGAVMVAVLAIAGYALLVDPLAGPATPGGQAEPAISAVVPTGEPEDARSGLSTDPATVSNPGAAKELLSATPPAAEPSRPEGDNTPLEAPASKLATGRAISERPSTRLAAASRIESVGDSGTAPNSDSVKEISVAIPEDSLARHSKWSGAPIRSPEPEERYTADRPVAVPQLVTTRPLSVSIPPRDLSAAATPDRPGEQHWRLSLSWGIGSYDISPRVSFYRLDEEIPNQESILPEEGPEELFLVGEFPAFEAAVANQHYRFSPEYRIGKQWWMYGGVRHQRSVYRLDDERTNYPGTEADLLFRGRIRYRETGVEAGLIYQIKPFRWGLANVLNILEVRAGAYYATERTRIFDGTLQARELPAALPFRYREELLPRYRWGFQAEIIDRIRLSDRMDLSFGTGLFCGSDGVVRFIPARIGILRQL